MLKELDLENFTTFKHAKIHFASGLNVVVGQNGSGKTHLLKLAYSAIYASARGHRDQDAANPTKSQLQTNLAEKLCNVFRPDELGRLVRRGRGRQRCQVACRFAPGQQALRFSFSTASQSEVVVSKTPSAWIDKLPVYLPTRELLTIYPGFVSLYETTHLPFEETWRDTCILLGAPLARGPREKRIKELLEPLEKAMGGKIELDKAGRFYLNNADGSMEMHLVAEGIRKLATIARLIATGSLGDKGYLFWDEPESNLNPRVVKIVARTILHLCQTNIQVFLASHSLFLIRELDILLRSDAFKDVNCQFIGLNPGADGVEVQQGPSVDDIGDISALDEELSQSDRYLNLEARS